MPAVQSRHRSDLSPRFTLSAPLGITPVRTCRFRVQHMLQKLSVDSRTSAANFAVRHGLA
jgi:hypothetical protein